MSSSRIVYSICIPFVFRNISEKRIRAIFYSLKFGFVERVDMVPKTDRKSGQEIFQVFVHFSSWNTSLPSANKAFELLEAGEKVKIVYDNPWFWMISKSKTKVANQHPRPFIDFSHGTPPQQSPPWSPGAWAEVSSQVGLCEGIDLSANAVQRCFERAHPATRHNACSPSSPKPPITDGELANWGCSRRTGRMQRLLDGEGLPKTP